MYMHLLIITVSKKCGHFPSAMILEIADFNDDMFLKSDTFTTMISDNRFQ